MRFFTKEWYGLQQEYGRTFEKEKKSVLKKELDNISEAFQRAIAREELPKELWNNFAFHDGIIRNIQEGPDYIIEVDSPFNANRKLTFYNAVVKQDNICVGAVWLYEELYRHALGYEAHILSQVGLELRDTKIICSEIKIEE